MDDSFIFNNNILKFHFNSTGLPEFDKTFYKYRRYLLDGIRLVDNDNKPNILCVICDQNFDNIDQVGIHIKNDHNNTSELLRNTPLKPVVGLDQIEEYKDSNNGDIIEYKCNLCSLYFNRRSIIWHIISYHHKENFFKKNYSTDFIDQIDDPKVKHEKVDHVLLNYEKNNGRGLIQTKNWLPGMIRSNIKTNTQKLNLSYMKKLYPNEKRRLDGLSVINPRLNKRLKSQLSIKIENDEQYEQGKKLLMRINQSLIEYKQ